MIRRGFALAATAFAFVSLNGCCHWRDRPHPLLDRLRGRTETAYTDPYYPGPMTGYPTGMPMGGAGNGSCCGGASGVPMMIPGGGMPGTMIPGSGMPGGSMPGIVEQPPGSFPGSNPVPMLPSSPPMGTGSDNARPLPAGPSPNGDMTKGTRPGRVTNLPDGK